MGCSCSKSNRVDVVEDRRPVRKVSVKNGRQPTPTSTQGQRRTDGKVTLRDGFEQNRPNTVPLQDVAKTQQTDGEEGSTVPVEAVVHEEPKEAAAVTTEEQIKKEQTSPNNQHSKGTVPEPQEAIGEQDGQVQANVQEDSPDRSAQNDERADATATHQKTAKPRTKKDLIPDLQVFKDLDERAVQAPEGHASIKDLVLYLIQTAKTPLEKARVLFRWVTSHIQYDVVSYVTGGSKDVTPGGVFKKRMSVCQGYSDLYKEMCSLAEVECVTISGRSKGGSYRVGDKFGPGSDHAWNAVKIDGRWYLIDSTWAAGNTDLQERTFKFKYNEHYFFTDPEVFVTNHHPMDNKWQLLEEPVPLEVFENQVELRPPFFTLGLVPQFLSHTVSPVRTQNGEATISIKLPEPMTFMYHIYPYEGGSYQDEKVLYEIVDSVAMFKVALPPKGKFLLQFYGRRGTASGQFNQICSYMVDSDGSNQSHVPFPRLGTFTWGPGPWLLDEFISDVSHPNALVTLPEGEAKITFNSGKPLQYMCNMKEDDRKWDNYALPQVNDREACVYIKAPKTGQFTLTIWAKEENDQTYSKYMYYLLRCNKCNTTISPFPQTFNNWTNGCRLYEPLDGRLAANRRVHFRVACPNAVEVVVIATQWHKLVRKADGSWAGDADTGEQGRVLKVSAKMAGGGTSYSTLLQYEVVA